MFKGASGAVSKKAPRKAGLTLWRRGRGKARSVKMIAFTVLGARRVYKQAFN